MKGSGRVGRSQKLEDRLKIQLAVNAHIRHRLTQYDSLLAANRGQDAKLAAREMVYRQVQAIADSWRDTSSQAQTSKTRMSISRNSAAILEGNRQRRAQQGKANIKSTDETQMLDEALEQLRLKENGEKAEAQVEATRQMAQKKAQKKARKSCSLKINQDLSRQYELYSSIGLSKKKQKKVLRLQKEQQKTSRKSIHPPQILRSELPAFDGIPTISDTLGDGTQLGQTGHDNYMPTSDGSVNIDTPHQPRYFLRSSRGNIPMKNDRFSNDVQLQQREEDNHISDDGTSPNTHPPHQSCSSRRNNIAEIGNLDSKNERGGSSLESRSEGRQKIESYEWMDIDEVPLESAETYLA